MTDTTTFRHVYVTMAQGNCNNCGKQCESTPRWGYKCPDCARQYLREWAAKRRAAGLPSSGKTSPEREKVWRTEYNSRPEIRARLNARAKKYRNDPMLRMKHEARWQMQRAIASKKLIRQPCVRCGNKKSQGHHPDYYKPLEVVWLCSRCHTDEHNRLKNEKPKCK